MLYLDKPIGPIEGLMIYCDHEDTGLFYYIPERPRLARNESGPEFVFLKYKRDITDNAAFDPNQSQSLGGGFMAFTVDLSVDEQQMRRVKSKLSSFSEGAEVRLAPAQFHKGSVRLSICKDNASSANALENQPQGLTLFEEVYGTTMPSLFGSNRATFSLILSQEGATLFEESLKAGISPIGVIYELTFLGLRPAFNVHVTADYHRIYNDLEIGFGARGQIYAVSLAADINLAFQKLRDDGAIKVEVMNFSDQEDLLKQSTAAFDWIKQDLLKDFFRPAIEPPSFMRPPAGGNAGQTQGGVQAGGVQAGGATGTPPRPATPPTTTTPPRPATPPTTTTPPRPATPPTGAGTSAHPTAPSPTGASTHVTPPASGQTPPPAGGQTPPPTGGQTPPPTGGQTPPPTGGQTPPPTGGQTPPPTGGQTPPPTGAGKTPPPAGGQTPPPGGQTPPPGGTGGKQAGGASSLSPFQVSFSLKYLQQDELKTREYDYSVQSAVARDAAPQGLFSTLLADLDLSTAIREINMDDDFFKRIVASVSASNDMAAAGIDQVVVNLQYPGATDGSTPPLHVDGFKFNAANTAPQVFTCWLDDQKDLSYRYQVETYFKPDSPWSGKLSHDVSDWKTTSARQLVVEPLDEVGLLDLQVTFGVVDTALIGQVQVDLRYEDAPNDFRAEQTFLMKPGEPAQHWKLRLCDGDQKTYQYRITYFMAENAQIQTDWASSSNPTLVINSPFRGLLNVRLMPLLNADELLEATVDLTYHEDETGYTRRIQKTLTPDALKGQSIAIPTLAPNPAGYSYDVTIIRADGSVYGPASTDSSGPVALISDGAGATHRIKVKLLGQNMTTAGLAALKVTLTGEGDEPDTDTVLFTPSQSDDKTAVLVQPDADGTFVYTYRVTGYDEHGQPIDGAQGQGSDGVLIVPLPTL